MQTTTERQMSAMARTQSAKTKWTLCSFEVFRRGDPTIRPYRTVVYSPEEDTAEHAVGISSDEFARRVKPSFLDGLGASKNVSGEEIADFWENMALTVGGGGTEVTAILRATRMAKTARFRGVLGSVRANLNRGRPLHESLAKYPKIFRVEQTALAEAAEQLVPLQRAKLYNSLATTLREQSSRARHFHATMFDQYINWALLVVLMAMVLFVFIPNSESLYKSLNITMPDFLKTAVKVSDFAKVYWPVTIVSVVSVLVGGYFGFKAAVASKSFQRVYSTWPIIGPVVRGIALARSLPIFALLKSANVHPERMFRISGSASGNGLVEEFFRRTHERCIAGAELERAFLSERFYLGIDDGRRLAGKIESSAEANELQTTLDGLAKEFGEAARSRIETLPKVLKPLSLGASGLVILVAISLILLPTVMSLKGLFDQQNKEAIKRLQEQKQRAEQAAQRGR